MRNRWLPRMHILCFLTEWDRAPVPYYVYANTRLASPLLLLSDTVALSYTKNPLQNYFSYDASADANRIENEIW